MPKSLRYVFWCCRNVLLIDGIIIRILLQVEERTLSWCFFPPHWFNVPGCKVPTDAGCVWAVYLWAAREDGGSQVKVQGDWGQEAGETVTEGKNIYLFVFSFELQIYTLENKPKPPRNIFPCCPLTKQSNSVWTNVSNDMRVVRVAYIFSLCMKQVEKKVGDKPKEVKYEPFSFDDGWLLYIIWFCGIPLQTKNHSVMWGIGC